MNKSAFCGECGSDLGAGTKFCPSCGSEQSQFHKPAPARGAPDHADHPTAAGERPVSPGRDESARAAGSPAAGRPGVADRVEQFSPSAGEFASRIVSQAQTPGVIAAATAAGIAAAGCLVVGLLLAIIFPDDSLLGLYGGQTGLIGEALSQTVSFLQVSFFLDADAPPRVAPLLFVAIPIGLCSLGAYLQANRTRAMSPRARLLWGAATGVAFGLIMLVAALAAGDTDPSVGGSFFLGLLFGALGGLVGARRAMKRDSPETLSDVLPSRVQAAARVLASALRPLLAALAVTTLIGISVWWVQGIRDEGGARLASPLPITLVQDAAYSADLGIRYLALGAGVQFGDAEASGPSSNPSGELQELEDALGEELGMPEASGMVMAGAPGANPIPADGLEEEGERPARLFDYSDNVTAPLFVPLLILLIGIPLILSLYAGFATARAAAARTSRAAAAWGALVGPLWAVTMVLLNAVSQDVFAGVPSGDSVFINFLLGGALLGALGGLLSTQTAGEARAFPEGTSHG
jgi:hypothetical protein